MVGLLAAIPNYRKTQDVKIGRLKQSFLDDLQVVIDAKAAVAQSRRDAYELKRREREQEATKKRCDEVEAAAASFLNESITANVTNVHEPQVVPGGSAQLAVAIC